MLPDLLSLKNDYVVKHAMGGLYDAGGVPYQVVAVCLVL
jgi:hypothetical protein